MPCSSSDGMTYYADDQVRRKLQATDAILCGVLRALEKAGLLGAVIEAINEETAGITRNDVLVWFRDHQKRDAARGG